MGGLTHGLGPVKGGRAGRIRLEARAWRRGEGPAREELGLGRRWALCEKTQARATWISSTLAQGQVNEGAAPVSSFTKQGMQVSMAADAERIRAEPRRNEAGAAARDAEEGHRGGRDAGEVAGLARQEAGGGRDGRRGRGGLALQEAVEAGGEAGGRRRGETAAEQRFQAEGEDLRRGRQGLFLLCLLLTEG